MSARVLGRSSVRRSLIGLALTAVVGTYAAFVGSADAAEIPISQGQPVTASSTENGGSPPRTPSTATRGTRWSSAFSDPQWLQVDLGAPATITQVVLNWEAAYARDFTIQTSANGTSWTTINTTVAGTGGVQTLNVSGSGRYVRLNTTRRATQYGVSLWEFQVFGTGGTAPTRPAHHPAGRGPGRGVPRRLPVQPPAAGRPDRLPRPAGRLAHAQLLRQHRRPTPTATVDDLVNGHSNCNPAIDKSSYWVPTLYNDNVAVEPDRAPRSTTSVRGSATRIARDPAAAARAADRRRQRQGDRARRHHHLPLVLPARRTRSARRKDFVNCPAGTMLESYLDFPQCWNGRDLDSADHKSHMAYPVNGACPATHPVPVPKLRQVLRYPVNGDPARIRLARVPGTPCTATSSTPGRRPRWTAGSPTASA